MTAETEYWACSVCRSINPRRSNRCYSCHTPREAAGVKPTDLPTTGQAPPVVHKGTFRSTETRAVLVTVAGAAFIFASLAASIVLWNAADLRTAGQRAAAEDLMSGMTLLFVVVPVLGILALVAYAAWISRVVANLPALGLGYSRVSPEMAFVEPLIPGFNLYALPARMGEAIRKLDEKSAGLALLGLAFLLVIGAPLVLAVLIRFTRALVPIDELFAQTGFALFLAATFVALGLAIGLYLVWLVERLQRTRAEQHARAPRTAGTTAPTA